MFLGAIQGMQLKSLEEILRFYFIAFAYHVPHLAAEYLNTFNPRTLAREVRKKELQIEDGLIVDVAKIMALPC